MFSVSSRVIKTSIWLMAADSITTILRRGMLSIKLVVRKVPNTLLESRIVPWPQYFQSLHHKAITTKPRNDKYFHSLFLVLSNLLRIMKPKQAQNTMRDIKLVVRKERIPAPTHVMTKNSSLNLIFIASIALFSFRLQNFCWAHKAICHRLVYQYYYL